MLEQASAHEYQFPSWRRLTVGINNSVMSDGILRDSMVLEAILDVLRRDRREGGRIIEKLVVQPAPLQGSVPGHSYPGEVALQHDWHWKTPERGVQVLDTTAHVIQIVMGLPTVELGTSRLRYLTTL
jgi:hypothetical protein